MSADEMFRKLGYEKYKEEYLGKTMKELYGNNADKTIEVYDFYDGSRDFTIEELQAINKKCEELGWLDKNIKEMN